MSSIAERASGSPSLIFIQKGVAHYRAPLFERLWERFGWRVACAAVPKSRTFKKIVDRPFIRRWPYRVVRWPLLIMDLPAWRIVREMGADVVVAEFSMFMTSTYKLALMRWLRPRPKLVFWTHGAAAHRRREGMANRLLDGVRLSLLRRADAVACYSEDGREYLGRFLDASRLFVVHNTIDVEPMRRLRAELEPPARPAGPHLLAVGRMTADKRFPSLVRVFRRLLEGFPQARLTIVGDGPDMPAVRRAAGDLVGAGVHLPGLVYDEADLAPYFLSADLFVFTGAVGLSVNHALAYGLPVVTYRRTANGPFHHPEIAYVVDGVTGWLVDEFSEEAMATRLSRIFHEHPRPAAELRAEIDRYVDDNLRIERMVDGFVRIRTFLDDRDRQPARANHGVETV